MNNLAILGIGSPFGDDQVGWEVVRQLEQCAELKKLHVDVRLACCDRPGMGLLELMQNRDEVILIDAVKTGAPIGTWRQFHRQEMMQIYTGVSTHGIGVGYALQLGAALQLLPERITLYGIEVGEISSARVLSSQVEQAGMQLCHYLITALAL